MATLRYTFLDIPLTSNLNRSLIFEKCFVTLGRNTGLQTADQNAGEIIFFLIHKLFYSMTGNVDFTGFNLVESFILDLIILAQFLELKNQKSTAEIDSVFQSCLLKAIPFLLYLSCKLTGELVLLGSTFFVCFPTFLFQHLFHKR